MSNKQNEELSFEASIEQLEAIVKKLESGELPLEEALNNFEVGIKLANQGQAQLKQAQQRVQILLEKNELAELNNYDEDEHAPF